VDPVTLAILLAVGGLCIGIAVIMIVGEPLVARVLAILGTILAGVVVLADLLSKR
jgi:hypothetical protein